MNLANSPSPPPNAPATPDFSNISPVPEGRKVLELRVVPLADLRLSHKLVLRPEDPRWPDALRYGFVDIADAIVTPSGFVIADGALIVDNQRLAPGWMRGRTIAPHLLADLFAHNFIHALDADAKTCRLSVPLEAPEIAAPTFLFHSRQTPFNFGHFVHDTLLQTPTYHDAVAFTGEAVVPLLAGTQFAYPAMRELFAMAMPPQTAPTFLRDRFLKVKRLLAPTDHFSPLRDEIATGAAWRLRETLGAALADYRGPTRRRLFVSREDSARWDGREPRFDNSDALSAALAPLGFETIVAGRLDIDEYLRAFHNAEILVGLHGAGLMNIALCTVPRLLEIIVPGYSEWRSVALYAQRGLGAPYRRLTTQAPRDGVATYEVPAIVDACRALLAAPTP